MFYPVFFFLGKLITYRLQGVTSVANLAYSIAAFGGVLGYAFLMMLHPFSTELSEWGIWALMVSLLSTFSGLMLATDDTQVEA
ncbi:hypothetical protein GHO43_26870 [Pseudomonas sp. FSL R10-0071]|nr:hypothetical protein [Pseudomonas sp. FSL R10-0071]